MKVRAIDSSNDWQFGKGLSDYKKDIQSINQNLKTRLQCFLGDCFFDTTSGIDWFNLLGSKDRLSLNLAISTTISNTEGVTSIIQLSTNLDSATRKITITYEVSTVYSKNVSGVFDFTVGNI